MIAGKPFRLVGLESGQELVSACMPKANELDTLRAIHEVFSIAMTGAYGTHHLAHGLEVQIQDGTTAEGQPNWVPLSNIN